MSASSLEPIQEILHRWILAGQALVGSVGALAFIAAFIWKIVAVEPQSVTESKRWIGRIVVGTIGVEMAGTLVQILTGSLSH